MTKRKVKVNTPLVAFRMAKELTDRLDQHAERMGRAHPGLTFTRADAVRELLTRALDAAEAADKRTRS